MTHDKESFAREYCRCRKVPYKIDLHSLIICGDRICQDLRMIPYVEIVHMIDAEVEYDPATAEFLRRRPTGIMEVI